MKKWFIGWLAVILLLSMAGCTAEPQPTSSALSDLQGQQLELGDPMPNFSITDIDGNTYTLAQMLEEKDLVMLNFWFANCKFCVYEFPAIEAAFAQRKENVAVLAINPYDDADKIRDFRTEHDLSFALCQDSPGLCEAFGIQGYPTTVMIDRNGTVCVIHGGALPYESVFLKIFDHFSAEDYQTELFDSFADMFD